MPPSIHAVRDWQGAADIASLVDGWAPDAPPCVVRWHWAQAGLCDQAWLPTLSPEERTRAARYHQPADRLRFMAGRHLARQALGVCLGLPPEEVPIQLGLHGKPQVATLSSQPALHFNLSHAGDWVLLALSRVSPVGVDIEQVQSTPEWEAIAPKIMDPAGYAAWRGLSARDQVTAFFAAWTQREAGLKALGLGLADDLALPEDTRLQIRPLTAPMGYAAALAWIDRT